MNPQDIVSSTPQQSHTVSRHVFVSAQTHRIFSLVRGGKDPFLTQQVSRISKAGADVFLCEAGVIPQNFFLAPSFGEQIQYEFNRQSRSSNDGLAGQNGRVSHDVVMPVHQANLSFLVELRPVAGQLEFGATNCRRQRAGERRSHEYHLFTNPQ